MVNVIIEAVKLTIDVTMSIRDFIISIFPLLLSMFLIYAIRRILSSAKLLFYRFFHYFIYEKAPRYTSAIMKENTNAILNNTLNEREYNRRRAALP